MDILFCTSEAYPLMKTGGLADVSGSLPQALLQLEYDVRLVLPAYPGAVQAIGSPVEIARLSLTGSDEAVRILRGRLPDSELPVYLVDAPAFFNRPGNPYLQPDGNDWPDNAERFALFARACVALALGEGDRTWRPQVVHCNDWQTGLVPVLLAEERHRPATVFSIHNLAYQGLFPAETLKTLQLPDTLWSIDGLEFYNMLSFMKGGIANADRITTVSPTYAREILEDEFGYGLEGLLRYRSARLSGILNGIDVDAWNPATDTMIARRYDVHTLQHKLFNKFTLQRDRGLPVSSQPVLLAYVGRLVEQKGVDLIVDVIDDLAAHPIQLVVLGTGERTLEQQLQDAAQRYPKQVSITVGFDETLAHRIQAGADALLMPSRYEPCGLNQMYSQIYGTVPIVRTTGGLADTVVDFNRQTVDDDTATGFCFEDDSSEALLATCLAAINTYQNQRVDWWKLVIAGMHRDFSWSASARRYGELYKGLVSTGADRDLATALDPLSGSTRTPGTQHSGQRLH
ncbi:MAG: glycogen synthase GlgA [Gammaproteobacteria bacterium]|jgi:starch synthase